MSDEINLYLYSVLSKYAARDLTAHSEKLLQLRLSLKNWAASCYKGIIGSGSRIKGTAISMASDVDYMVSLTSDCHENNGGLKGIYESLFHMLNKTYYTARKQNVSVRVNLDGLEIDVTPAQKQPDSVNNHSLYVSKLDTWKKTNIQKHVQDVKQSGRTNEIKLLKIWRELHQLEFPSIYLEYLLINKILLNKSNDEKKLGANFHYIINELAKDMGNPLNARIVDPANSQNILSDLLTAAEKNVIINQAKLSIMSKWGEVVW